MPLTACTIQLILPTDNPNDGRVKINNNFDCLDNTISSFQLNNATGFTSISDGSNITTALSFSGLIPDYTISVVSDPIFNSLQSPSISADTYFLGTTNLAYLLSGTSVFTTGSTGAYSIKAINDSTTDAIGNYSYAEGSGTTASGIASHAGGNNSVASGDTSFIHSTNSFAIGARSAVLGGQNITGSTADTVYVPYLNVQSLYSGTSTTSLGIDSSGNIVSAATLNLGRILFVSTAGNDSTGEVGNLNKPWRNIYSAKSASTSGDTIYVLPGTWSYDNRDSAGNPFNGQIDTMVNLWKNGITYYFTPGAKVVFYNQTTSGQDMYLFGPMNTSGETCTVLGGLEWSGYSAGPDTSNGRANFFSANSNNDSGFTFSAEVKKLSSFANEIYLISRGVTFTSDTIVANFRLVADEMYHQYIGGQTGTGASEFINSTDSVLNAYI
jgi:hypothetical protein